MASFSASSTIFRFMFALVAFIAMAASALAQQTQYSSATMLLDADSADATGDAMYAFDGADGAEVQLELDAHLGRSLLEGKKKKKKKKVGLCRLTPREGCPRPR